MRPSTTFALLTATVLTTSAFTFQSSLQTIKSYLLPSQQQRQHQQAALMSSSPPTPQFHSSDSTLILSDILPQSKGINIFASLTQDFLSLSTRLDSADVNTTLLAPLNSVIQGLPRKPWEDEDEMIAAGRGSAADVYGLGDGEQRANENLKRFVERHVIPLAPWQEGEKVQTVGGKMLWWKGVEGESEGRVIMPGSIKARVERRVSNGEVWILEGVVGK